MRKVIFFLILFFLNLFTQVKIGNFFGDNKFWKLEGEELTGENNKEEWVYAFIDKEIKEDSVIEAEFTIIKGNNKEGSGKPDWFRYDIQRNDPGYDVCLIGRFFGYTFTENWWYRVQLSYLYQEIVLHKGNGGYVKVVPVKFDISKPLKLKMEIRGKRIIVWFNDKKVIDYEDNVAPIIGEGGKWGVGICNSTVRFHRIDVSNAGKEKLQPLPEREYLMSFRNWHKGEWIFCDDEPIAQIKRETMKLEEMKLLPGYKPQIMALLGAIGPDQGPATVIEEVNVIGEKENVDELNLLVKGKTKSSPKIETRIKIKIYYDKNKKSYCYEFDEKAIFDENDPNFSKVRDFTFNFLFPYSCSPHAWLGIYPATYKNDLFKDTIKLPSSIIRSDDSIYYYGWEIFYGEDGNLYKVPVRKDWDYPVPPKYGTRLYVSPDTEFKPRYKYGDFFARGVHPVCNPAIEFLNKEVEYKLNCSTCSFSHENWFGWHFDKPQKEIKAQYRFFGILPGEMNKIIKEAKTPPLPQINYTKVFYKSGINYFRPEQHNPVSEPLENAVWIGAYDIDKNTGYDDNYSLLLETNGWVEFKPLTKDGYLGYDVFDKYILVFYVKTKNVHGKGLYISVERDKEKELHYVGLYGDNDWKKTGIITSLLTQKGDAKVKIGLDGTGKVWIDNLDFRPLNKDEKIPEEVAEKPNSFPPEYKKPEERVFAEYRMEEGEGYYVYDYGGKIGVLELSNIKWSIDEGIKCLELSDENKGKNPLPPYENTYRSLSFAKNLKDVIFGFAGSIYGGWELSSFTICVPVKPHQKMVPGHFGGSIILSFGGRYCELCLKGIEPPYNFGLNLAYQEYIWTDEKIEQGKWYHFTVVADGKDKEKMNFYIYINGKLVKQEVSQKFNSPLRMQSILVIGAEPFYLHEAYFRGKIGKITIYDKALNSQEIESCYEEFLKQIKKEN